MAEQLGSPQLSLSSCSSFLSISSAAADGAPHLSLGAGGGEELDLLMQVGIGGGGGDEEEEERKTIRMMKNRESALRSRARKRAYVQELEKEVRRLVNENLKLKRHCKQLKTEMAALIQPTTKQSSHRRSSST